LIEVIALPGVRLASRAKSWNARWSAVVAQPDALPDNLGQEVRRMIASGWVEELMVRGDNRPEIINAVVEAARAAGRRVRMISSAPLAEAPSMLNGERWILEEDTENATWVLMPPQRRRWQLAIKRILDLLVAATLVVLLFPILVVIGVAVKLTSEGPVFYRWRVLGENGRPFVGFKFRTRVRDADTLKADLLHLNERRGPVFKITQDPRVTPLGRWLRKHSVDELPQLWSVIAGDMSLVGPRPVFPAEYQDFELWQMRKLSVKPGITCTWQLDGRQHVTDFSDWARLDLKYIDTWSLWNDLTILARTPIAIVKGTGH
jgi:lipopolysaccharide/colanic/teichoic acid biosynthesis glycosyltransferase